MKASSILLLAAAAVVSAYESQFVGHWNPKVDVSNMRNIVNCQFTIAVEGSPSCTQIADSQFITLRAFQELNPNLSCLSPVADGILVCVPNDPRPAEQQQGSDAGSSARTLSATALARVNATGTVKATLAATGTLTASRTSGSSASVSQSAGRTTGSAQAPEPTTEAVQAPVTTTEAWARPPTSEWVEPPKTEEPPVVVNPPVVVDPPVVVSPPSGGGDPDPGSCIALHNSARAAAGVAPLSWSDDIASNHAQPVANNCAASGCWNCHEDSGAGTIFAQNMYVSHDSCASAFQGWMDSPGHRENILSPSWTKFGCGSSGYNAKCSVCDFTW
ncbi:hypothetical protein HDU81_001609 [Chytriomyces hyalinus]|nr:hypothetical protein HDU81_001609 [Chytriomyces hyalinus]